MPNMKYYPYFKTEVEMRRLFATELLGEAVVANSPWFFNVIWQIIQPFLDKSTLEKIGFVSQEKLVDYVDAKYIPVILGGEDPAPKLVIPDPTKGMTAETIAAGKKLEISKVANGKDMAISWRFQILSRDIGYEAIFQDSEGVEEVIHAYERVAENNIVQEGSFVTPRAGNVIVRLDNSFSYWNGKDVLYAMTDFLEASALE